MLVTKTIACAGATIRSLRDTLMGCLRSLPRAAAVVILLAHAGCGSDIPQLPPLGQDDIVVAFGDSLTYGTGANTEETYPQVLSELIGRTVIESGVPGEQTDQGRSRLPGVLEQYRPKILILCLGGNDMLRKVAADSIEGNLRAMVETARSQGVAVVLIGVPRPALFGGTADFYQRIAEDLNLPFEGEVLNEVLRNNEFKSDPIHPNAKGYRRIAEAVAQLLRHAGAV